MKPILKFASSALMVGGVTTGAGIGVHSYLNSSEEQKPETSIKGPKLSKISSLIESNYRMLSKEGNDEEEEAKWGKKWDKFKQDYAGKKQDVINYFGDFDDLELAKEIQNVPEKFKDKCLNNNEREVTDKEDPIFVAFKEYCLIDTSEGQEEAVA